MDIQCTWQDKDGTPCGQRAHGDGDLCLWHNRRVDKSDAYIIPLLEQELLIRSGNISGFQLQGIHWPKAEIPGGILREASLSDAILPHADLSGADLSDADLSRCHLSGANLEGQPFAALIFPAPTLATPICAAATFAKRHSTAPSYSVQTSAVPI